MPKSSKKAKNSKNHGGPEEKRKILEKGQDYQEYGRVTKVLGGRRFTIKLSTSGKTVMGKLRGAMSGGRRKRKNFVSADSVVLIAMRCDMTSDEVVDIIHVYDHSEVRALKKNGEFIEVEDGRARPEDGPDDDEEEECVFDFEDL